MKPSQDHLFLDPLSREFLSVLYGMEKIIDMEENFETFLLFGFVRFFDDFLENKGDEEGDDGAYLYPIDIHAHMDELLQGLKVLASRAETESARLALRSDFARLRVLGREITRLSPEQVAVQKYMAQLLLVTTDFQEAEARFGRLMDQRDRLFATFTAEGLDQFIVLAEEALAPGPGTELFWASYAFRAHLPNTTRRQAELEDALSQLSVLALLSHAQ